MEFLKGAEAYMPSVIDFGTSVLLCLLILIIGWIVSKWLSRLALHTLLKREIDEAASRFLASLVRWLVVAGAVIAALGTVGVETTSLVALLGSAGLAIGLALQGNLSHMASGVMILVFRPFTVGDVINTAGKTGKVMEIGLFSTVLHNPDNDKIVIPNGAITGGVVTNHTALGTRRTHVTVGVAYGADVVKVTELLLAAAKRVPAGLEDPAPAVAFVGLGASSLDFDVMTWCQAADYLAVVASVRTNIYDDLNEAGIEIPFSQIVVHKAED